MAALKRRREDDEHAEPEWPPLAELLKWLCGDCAGIVRGYLTVTCGICTELAIFTGRTMGLPVDSIVVRDRCPIRVLAIGDHGVRITPHIDFARAGPHPTWSVINRYWICPGHALPCAEPGCVNDRRARGGMLLSRSLCPTCRMPCHGCGDWMSHSMANKCPGCERLICNDCYATETDAMETCTVGCGRFVHPVAGDELTVWNHCKQCTREICDDCTSHIEEHLCERCVRMNEQRPVGRTSMLLSQPMRLYLRPERTDTPKSDK